MKMKKMRDLNIGISFFDIWFYKNRTIGLHILRVEDLSLFEIAYRVVYKQLAIELFGKRWVISFKRFGKGKEKGD